MQCPQCSEEVEEEAIVCGSCGRDLRAENTPEVSGPSLTSAVPGVGVTLVLVGAAIVAVGSFLPWVRFSGPIMGDISRTGMTGGWNGRVTLALAVGIAALCLARGLRARPTRRVTATLLAGGIGVGIMAIVDLREALARVEELSSASAAAHSWVGVGVWAVVVGAGTVLVGAIGLALGKE